MSYIWEDSDGVRYEKWEDMDIDHHKNVVAFLRRKASSQQQAWKKALCLEEVWLDTLLTLEDASGALEKR